MLRVRYAYARRSSRRPPDRVMRTRFAVMVARRGYRLETVQTRICRRWRGCYDDMHAGYDSTTDSLTMRLRRIWNSLVRYDDRIRICCACGYVGDCWRYASCAWTACQLVCMRMSDMHAGSHAAVCACGDNGCRTMLRWICCACCGMRAVTPDMQMLCMDWARMRMVRVCARACRPHACARVAMRYRLRAVRWRRRCWMLVCAMRCSCLTTMRFGNAVVCRRSTHSAR